MIQRKMLKIKKGMERKMFKIKRRKNRNIEIYEK